MASARAGTVPKENVNANTGNAPRSTGALRPRPHAGDAAMADLTEQVTHCIALQTYLCCSPTRMVVRLTLLCCTSSVMLLSMSLSISCTALRLLCKPGAAFAYSKPEAEGKHGGAGAGDMRQLCDSRHCVSCTGKLKH